MKEKMLKFVEIGQQSPPKRNKDERSEDFKEIYKEFIHDKAKEQSSRCSQCGVPFCQVHCRAFTTGTCADYNSIEVVTFSGFVCRFTLCLLTQ